MLCGHSSVDQVKCISLIFLRHLHSTELSSTPYLDEVVWHCWVRDVWRCRTILLCALNVCLVRTLTLVPQPSSSTGILRHAYWYRSRSEQCWPATKGKGSWTNPATRNCDESRHFEGLGKSTDGGVKKMIDWVDCYWRHLSIEIHWWVRQRDASQQLTVDSRVVLTHNYVEFNSNKHLALRRRLVEASDSCTWVSAQRRGMRM